MYIRVCVCVCVCVCGVCVGQRWCVHSLVPRPFPPPAFDRLQYANTEGEGAGLGDLVTCGYFRYVDRW